MVNEIFIASILRDTFDYAPERETKVFFTLEDAGEFMTRFAEKEAKRITEEYGCKPEIERDDIGIGIIARIKHGWSEEWKETIDVELLRFDLSGSAPVQLPISND